MKRFFCFVSYKNYNPGSSFKNKNQCESLYVWGTIIIIREGNIRDAERSMV